MTDNLFYMATAALALRFGLRRREWQRDRRVRVSARNPAAFGHADGTQMGIRD